jgi:hypothetical protein
LVSPASGAESPFGSKEQGDWYGTFYLMQYRRGFEDFWRDHLERVYAPDNVQNLSHK